MAAADRLKVGRGEQEEGEREGRKEQKRRRGELNTPGG
jgi:hypothetical protein